ncbi:MAG: Unknown protein [uncultured Sulfurovum sp.]|uniref:Uncharacterized protein n=1 Tax=uncultured Sulfurovum sp. TaxID=269237 RepID=A0A6S6TAM4_9BACT|nr:MAG: Unknown protein [uncultured Sulfurovum sp.]
MDNNITKIAVDCIQEELLLKDYFIIVGVTIAIVTFLYQLYINKKQFKMQIFFNYTDRYQNILIHLPIDVQSNDFDSNSLTEQDLKWFRAYFDLCSEEFYLAQKKLIDNDVWLLWKLGLKESLKKPAFMFAWKKIPRNNSYDEFDKFVKKLLLENKNI